LPWQPYRGLKETTLLLGEPGPTQADLHFRLFGFPVRVHPLFWIMTLLIGGGGFGGEDVDPIQMLLWTVAVFVSILVHELGHAVSQRHYGGHPHITLYGMGGLASCGDCDRMPLSQIIISLTGPVAGFLFAGVVLVAIMAAGHAVFPLGRLDDASIQQLLVEHPGGVWSFEIGWKKFGYEAFASMQLNMLISDLLWINIWWGLVNLLPIYPLDGGHVARELLTLRDARQGIVGSLWLSVVAAGAVAGYGLMRKEYFLAILFGYLAYSSYRTLQAYQGR
jgi:Zn-dependent protease